MHGNFINYGGRFFIDQSNSENAILSEKWAKRLDQIVSSDVTQDKLVDTMSNDDYTETFKRIEENEKLKNVINSNSNNIKLKLNAWKAAVNNAKTNIAERVADEIKALENGGQQIDRVNVKCYTDKNISFVYKTQNGEREVFIDWLAPQGVRNNAIDFGERRECNQVIEGCKELNEMFETFKNGGFDDKNDIFLADYVQIDTFADSLKAFCFTEKKYSKQLTEIYSAYTKYVKKKINEYKRKYEEEAGQEQQGEMLDDNMATFMREDIEDRIKREIEYHDRDLNTANFYDNLHDSEFRKKYDLEISPNNEFCQKLGNNTDNKKIAENEILRNSFITLMNSRIENLRKGVSNRYSLSSNNTVYVPFERLKEEEVTYLARMNERKKKLYRTIQEGTRKAFKERERDTSRVKIKFDGIKDEMLIKRKNSISHQPGEVVQAEDNRLTLRINRMSEDEARSNKWRYESEVLEKHRQGIKNEFLQRVNRESAKQIYRELVFAKKVFNLLDRNNRKFGSLIDGNAKCMLLNGTVKLTKDGKKSGVVIKFPNVIFKTTNGRIAYFSNPTFGAPQLVEAEYNYDDVVGNNRDLTNTTEVSGIRNTALIEFNPGGQLANNILINDYIDMLTENRRNDRTFQQFKNVIDNQIELDSNVSWPNKTLTYLRAGEDINDKYKKYADENGHPFFAKDTLIAMAKDLYVNNRRGPVRECREARSRTTVCC